MFTFSVASLDSPSIDHREDVRAVVSRGEDDASVWGLESPLSVVPVEAVQGVHAIGDPGHLVALEQQFGHHLATVDRVARSLRHRHGVFNLGLAGKEAGHVFDLAQTLMCH